VTQGTQPLETPPALAAKPRKQDRTTLALLMVAALIAIGGVGFAAGRATAPAAASTGNGNTNPLGGGGFGRGNFPSLAPGQTFNVGQFGGNFRGAGSVTGTVVSIDATSITVKLADGSTVKVLLTGTTTFHSETAATSTDVQAGATVRIETATSAGSSPAAGASGQTGQRTLTAGDVLITNP
jgi:hypothetical protein